MRTALVMASAAGLCVLLFTANRLAAQRPAPAGRPHSGAALVNFSDIMQQSNRFKQSMEALKKDYEDKAAELKKKADHGNQLTEELRKMAPSDPKRKELEDRIMKMRADYDLDGRRVTEEVRDNEAKIVLEVLNHVKGDLARFAPPNGVQLILRYDKTPPDLTDPRMILQEIHKPIVYQSGLDATATVLDAHNRGAVAGRPPQPAAAPPNAYKR